MINRTSGRPKSKLKVLSLSSIERSIPAKTFFFNLPHLVYGGTEAGRLQLHRPSGENMVKNILIYNLVTKIKMPSKKRNLYLIDKML